MYDSDDYIYIYIQKFNERKDNVSVCLSFKDGQIMDVQGLQ